MGRTERQYKVCFVRVPANKNQNYSFIDTQQLPEDMIDTSIFIFIGIIIGILDKAIKSRQLHSEP